MVNGIFFFYILFIVFFFTIVAMILLKNFNTNIYLYICVFLGCLQNSSKYDEQPVFVSVHGEKYYN